MKMSESSFISSRNSQLVGSLLPCAYCGYVPTDYMDKVSHKETKHKVPRGITDNYQLTGGDPRFIDEEYYKQLKQMVKDKRLRSENYDKIISYHRSIGLI